MKKLVLAALLASCAFGASAAEKINFGVSATYPPFESIGANNEIVGFDIDLAKALCKQMQAECTFTNHAFDSLIPSLKFRKYDAVISGMDITPERSKQVSFTTPYYENSAVVIAKKDTYKTFADLKGKRIGMENGTTHQKYIQDQHPEVKTVSYDSYRKRTARAVLTGMCYSAGSAMRHGSSSLTRLTGQSAMTPSTWRR